MSEPDLGGGGGGTVEEGGPGVPTYSASAPVPGFIAPAPRTWSQGDVITASRLRGDMANLAYLYAGGARPIVLNITFDQQVGAGAPAVLLNTANTPLNTWNVPVFGSYSPYYSIPLPGWYLVQGGYSASAGGGIQTKYAMGFQTVVNGGTGTNRDGGAVPASSDTNVLAGPAGADLYQFNNNSVTGDVVALYLYANTPVGLVRPSYLTAEWVGLPTSGLTGYSGPYGTVVSSPHAAAPFPSGPGTTITNSGGISVGATSLTVADATGVVTGGTLGLDFLSGQLSNSYAEPVTILSVAGTTIGITATSYAHVQGAPVAVPVSAAFLNQQCRDIVNFLSYPPMLRASTSATQSIASGTFPTGVQVTQLSANLDNFSGFASNTYTVPVSGVYFVYGQVYYAGSTAATAFGAGISVNGGTVTWGTMFRSDTTSGAQSLCATVRRHLRLTAGQTITLEAFQNSGSSVSTVAVTSNHSLLLAVWRSV